MTASTGLWSGQHPRRDLEEYLKPLEMKIEASPQRIGIYTDKENKPNNLDLSMNTLNTPNMATFAVAQWPILLFVSICRVFLFVSSSNV